MKSCLRPFSDAFKWKIFFLHWIIFVPRACKEKKISHQILNFLKLCFLIGCLKQGGAHFPNVICRQRSPDWSLQRRAKAVVCYDMNNWLFLVFMCGAPPGCGGEKSPSSGLSGDAASPAVGWKLTRVLKNVICQLKHNPKRTLAEYFTVPFVPFFLSSFKCICPAVLLHQLHVHGTALI